jgi:hypothetical protein
MRLYVIASRRNLKINSKKKRKGITCVKCVCRMEGWKLGDRAIQMTFHPILSISYDGRLNNNKKKRGGRCRRTYGRKNIKKEKQK